MTAQSKSESEVIAMPKSTFPTALSRCSTYTLTALLALALVSAVAQSGQSEPRRPIAVSLAASGPPASKCSRLLSDRVTLEQMKARFTNQQIADRMLNLGDCIAKLPQDTVANELYLLEKSVDFHNAMATLLRRALDYMNENGTKDSFLAAPLK